MWVVAVRATVVAEVVTVAVTARLVQVVLDAEDARGLAEFYRALLGYRYRDGDEHPSPDEHGDDWLVLLAPDGTHRIAFQRVPELARATWPDGPVPQQLHLDLAVPTAADLEAERERALSLGAALLLDRSDDEEEPLYAFTDPAGHPFCIFSTQDDVTSG